MLRPAINAGFKRAFRAILDSNITTLIAALVLGIFAQAPSRALPSPLA
jgi:preprotein translocase subunit SecD